MKTKFFSKIIVTSLLLSAFSNNLNAFTEKESQAILWGCGSAVGAKLMTSGVMETTNNPWISAGAGLLTACAVMAANKNTEKPIQFAAGLIVYAILLKAKLFNNHI